MAKSGIQYAVADAFTAEPFKGNPAAVCLLKDAAKSAGERRPTVPAPWFTPAAEVPIFGHATLASAHFLFTSVLAEHEALIEFSTKSGILTAKKVPAPLSTDVSGTGKLFIELNFPMIDLVECQRAELPSVPETPKGASVVSVHKLANVGDLIVELSSAKEVADIIPNIHEIKNCCRGVVFTGPAPEGSGYDFFSRFFCPKLNIDMDPVCGSAHCVLLGCEAGVTKTDGISSISTERNIIPGVGTCRQESANSGRSCHCDDWYRPSLASPVSPCVLPLMEP